MTVAVGYLNPLFLYGLGALSLPIIIHLLFRKRRKRIRFSTLRFLKLATRENARRRRLKQLILLLLRTAIVGLIVFAFARPFLRNPALAGIGPGAKEVVFVVDRSFSMDARSELGETRSERGSSYLVEMAGELTTGDRAAVVAFDETPELIHEMTDDFGAVRAALARIRTGTRATNIASAIAFAQNVFDSESPRQKVIFLVSDLQMSGLGEPVEAKLHRGVTVDKMPDLTHPAGNVAVGRLEAAGDVLQSAVPLVIGAEVRNYSAQPRSCLATLTIGGEAVEHQRVTLDAAESATVEFKHRFKEPGIYGASVSLRIEDALDVDDRAFAALDVRRAFRVLCVNGTPSQIPYFRETHYLETALNPYRFSAEPGTTIFDPRVIGPDELAAQTLTAYDAVVLANVDYLDAAVVAALEQYVRDGGGLLIFTGDRVSLIQYNRDLYKDGEGLLPARLDVPTGTLLDATVFWEITNFDEDHYIFAPFSDPTAGDLSVPRFQRIHRLGPIDEARAHALAFFNDGRPMLVQKTFGKGRVLLVPTSADADWNDMPKRKVYLPFVHRAIGYLCGAQGLAPVESSYLVGEPVPLPKGAVEVRDPKGRVIALNDTGVLRQTDAPGLYTVRLDDGSERPVAVNVNPAESDLRSYSVADFRGILEGEAERVSRAGLDDDGLADRDEIWQYLFMALLMFLLVEGWLANRTHV